MKFRETTHTKGLYLPLRVSVGHVLYTHCTHYTHLLAINSLLRHLPLLPSAQKHTLFSQEEQ